jgi:hypothetical protein
MTCLDAVDGAKGTRIKINPCSGKLGQKWSFTNLATTALPNGDPIKPVIKNIAQNFCIDAEGSWNNPLDQMYNGRNAVIWDCTGTTNQQFVKYEKGELLAKCRINNVECTNTELASLNSVILSGAKDPINIGEKIQALVHFFNPIQAIAQTIETITKGTTTVQTTTNPCYTDTVSDSLVCSIARSPDPVLDPLEAILDSVNTKDITPPTIEEKATIAKAEKIAEIIEDKLEAQVKASLDNPNTVVEQTKLDDSFEAAQSNEAKELISTVSGQIDNTVSPQSQALQTLLNKAPTLEQYKQSGGVTNAPEAEAKTSFLDGLNPFKALKADAQSRPTGSYFIQNYFLNDLVFDITGGNTANGNSVILSKKHGGINQRWTWNPSTGEVKGLDNKCLDAGNNNAGDFLRINDCTGNGNQKWSFTQNYGIQSRTGNRYCVGTQTSPGRLSLNVNNNYGLYMIDCNYANCSRYYDYQGAGGYNTTQIELNCVVSGGGSNPPPTNTGGTTGGTTASGGTTTTTSGTTTTNTGGTQTNQNIIYDESLNYSSTEIINEGEILGTDFEVVIPEDDQNISQLASSSLNNASVQLQNDILNGVSNCKALDLACYATNTTFQSGARNAIYAIQKLLEGIGAGLLFSIDIFAIVSGLWSALNNLSGILGTLQKLFTNPNLLIKGFLDIVDNFNQASIYDKMWMIGKAIGEVVGNIAITILTAGASALIANISKVSSGIGILSKINRAASLIGKTIGGIGTIFMKAGKAVLKPLNIAIDKLQDLSKYAINALQKSKLLLYINSLKRLKIARLTIERLDHIAIRHSFESTTRASSKFLSGQNLQNILEEGLSKLQSGKYQVGIYNVDGVSYNYLVDMGRNIGTNRGGNTRFLQISIDPTGLIKTAYPK